MRKVWFNGDIVPESEAKLSIYDSALMFGDMVFEMTRSFNKIQFKLKEHIDRLFVSIKYVHIPFKYSEYDIHNAVNEVVKENDPYFKDNDEHRIMINVSRGILPIYREVEEVGTNVIISDFPLRWTVAGMGELFNTGIDMVIPSQRSIPARYLEPKIKSRSRLHLQIANIEVSKYSGSNNWALLLDDNGFITEGTGDNFFIIKDEKIITPEGRNILRGISRAYIFELAKQLRLECIEKNIEPFDVYEADEAFITATPFCILPVATLNKRIIGKQFRIVINRIVINNLIYQWSENVGVDIVKQIKEWDKENKKEECTSPYQFKG